MKNDKRPFHSAANYYYENGKDLKQALEWENKALEANPTAYWMLHLKAKIQHKLGDNAGALDTANKSMEEARKADGDAYVKMNEALIAEIKSGKK
jgi:tetratricopeptide (TPR) repeat protein